MPEANKQTEASVTAKAQSAQDGAAGFFRRLFDLPANWYTQRDIFKNNYELGIKQFHAGSMQDAIFRFRLATWLSPGHALGWYWLGRSYLRNENNEQAAKALQKANELKPSDAHIQYMLAVALGKKAPAASLPKSMPLDILKEYFTRIAPSYNAAVKTQKREEHTQVAIAAKKAAKQGRIDHVVLDLAVGTGLCGAELKDISAKLIGVDFCEPMIEQAMLLTDEDGKKLYDELIEREAVDFLSHTQDNAFDMVLASGFMQYVGRPELLFKEVARVLKPGGLFVFSALKAEGTESRFNAELERFTHSENDIASCAQEVGLTSNNIEEADLAPGQKGLLGVFTK